MRTLVVFADPTPPGAPSVLRDAHDRVTAALQRHPGEVTSLDLGAIAYPPYLSAQEWTAYLAMEPDPDATVATHAALAHAAQQLVFIYPTVWFGLPPVLKGWLERTMIPGTAFTMDASGRVRGNLTNLQRIVGVSTYEQRRPMVAVRGDPGRRVLCRALRLSGPKPLRVRTRWAGLYHRHQVNPEAADQFLHRCAAAVAGTGR